MTVALTGVVLLAMLAYYSYQVFKEMQLKSNTLKKYDSILSPIGINEVNSYNLTEVDYRAKAKVFSLLDDYGLSENQVFDSNSSLGVCGYIRDSIVVSLEAHVTRPGPMVGIELFGFFKQYDPSVYHSTVQEIVKAKTKNSIIYLPYKSYEYTEHLEKMVHIIETPLKISSGRIIAVKDIEYYKVEGISQYVSDVTGGGANIAGAVYGGILAGGAGAVVGSKVGTEVKTEITKKDGRKLFLCYYADGVLKSEEIISDNIDCVYSLLRKWIPTKDYSYVISQRNSAPVNSTQQALPNNEKKQIEETTISGKHSYAELKELKELLDLGIITQEEFDRKKREMLGF